MANPGCYPTAANLAIRPLIKAEVVDREPRGSICDAKSGVSGAGRKATLEDQFLRGATENVYGIIEQRHVPEILRFPGVEESGN